MVASDLVGADHLLVGFETVDAVESAADVTVTLDGDGEPTGIRR